MAKGINRAPGDPNYDMYQLALRSTAQRLYPNYANVDWSGNEGYDKNNVKTYFSTMGCRTANGWDVNGFEQLKDGRGNIFLLLQWKRRNIPLKTLLEKTLKDRL